MKYSFKINACRSEGPWKGILINCRNLRWFWKRSHKHLKKKSISLQWYFEIFTINKYLKKKKNITKILKKKSYQSQNYLINLFNFPYPSKIIFEKSKSFLQIFSTIHFSDIKNSSKYQFLNSWLYSHHYFFLIVIVSFCPIYFSGLFSSIVYLIKLWWNNEKLFQFIAVICFVPTFKLKIFFHLKLQLSLSRSPWLRQWTKWSLCLILTNKDLWRS